MFGVCGCHVEYNIHLTKDLLKEDLIIEADASSSEQMEYYNYSKTQDYVPYLGTQTNYFQKKYDDSSKKISLHYDYDSLSTYNFAKAFKNCFESASIVTNNDEIIMKASGFLCNTYDYIPLDQLKINFSVKDYQVIKHNSNNVVGNVYSWQMVNEELPNIELILKKEEETNPKPEKPENDCQKKCNTNEELINPHSKDCYCRAITNEIQDDENTFLNYILLGAVLLLFFIGIIGLIKYKSVNKYE